MGEKQYLFKFYYDINIDRVIDGSPWTFNNHPLVFHTLKSREDLLRIVYGKKEILFEWDLSIKAIPRRAWVATSCWLREEGDTLWVPDSKMGREADRNNDSYLERSGVGESLGCALPSIGAEGGKYHCSFFHGNKLTEFALSSKDPTLWLVMEDFNEIAFSHGKQGGHLRGPNIYEKGWIEEWLPQYGVTCFRLPLSLMSLWCLEELSKVDSKDGVLGDLVIIRLLMNMEIDKGVMYWEQRIGGVWLLLGSFYFTRLKGFDPYSLGFARVVGPEFLLATEPFLGGFGRVGATSLLQNQLGAARPRVVIRNASGLLMGFTYFWNEYVSSLLITEAWAGLQTIRFVKDMGFRSVEVEGNSSVDISKFQSTNVDQSKFYVLESKKIGLAFEKCIYSNTIQIYAM
ncbi:hypothetical protein GOBAR_AA23395 [Gossypium barbadense]|uniref:DUF4283 domain-containing protein n=1 Tax=Gossypium barbadense TaxID=3634 RepID=A0A2P5X1R5_GOSBA|nr:hypothetical protein GOBAR_AA23395 [Gossypium barbadense]